LIDPVADRPGRRWPVVGLGITPMAELATTTGAAGAAIAVGAVGSLIGPAGGAVGAGTIGPAVSY
jgi:hypothetical protein